MALSGIQIFKMTPKKNCKECGCPTCMAFSMKVAQGAVDISKCPHMSAEALYSASPVPTLMDFIGGAVASDRVASASADICGHLLSSTAP